MGPTFEKALQIVVAFKFYFEICVLLSFLGLQFNRKTMSTESETPSNNLYVGNLSSQVTHSDLMNLFSKHGDLHSVTAPNTSRNYAFVSFNRIEDAKAAVEGLRGTVLRGNAIKIGFAKTVCSHLSASCLIC